MEENTKHINNNKKKKKKKKIVQIKNWINYKMTNM